MCSCGGSSAPAADFPVQQTMAVESADLWLAGDAAPVSDPPVAKSITGSVSISTGTAIALLVIVFVGLPLLRDLLGD